MSIVSGEFWFKVYMLLILSVGIMAFAILVMHFFVPKTLIEKYFKPPYFKPAECAMFSGFPFAIIRTIMFLRILGYPKSGKNRGLTEVYKLVPAWYRNISKIIVVLIIFISVSIVAVSIGFYIHSLIYSE